MKKIFVLDTNVLISDPNCINKFGKDNDILIPFIVLEELDNLKTRMDDSGKNARVSVKKIEKLRETGNLNKGVEIGTNKGSKLFVSTPSQIDESLGLDLEKNDNKIIAVASYFQKTGPKRTTKITLVSNDVNVRVKCDTLSIDSKPYENLKAFKDMTEAYSGVSSGQSVELADPKTFFPNQYFVDEMNVIYQMNPTSKKFDRISRKNVIFGLKPRNIEQYCAVDALLNPDIHLVTLSGKAGCGKSLLTIACGLELVLGTKPQYKKIIITRPMEPVGRDIGFLPGPQPLDAKIATPTGWTTMGQLSIGDYVISRDGKPTKVLGVYPKGKKDTYRITTTDGTSTEACEDHLWYTQTWENKKRNKIGSVKTTKEIMNSMISKFGTLNHYLPRNEPVHYEQKEALPIPAYTMGVLLGDGSIIDNPQFANMDTELIERVSNEVKSIGCHVVHAKNSITYRIKTDKLYNNKTAKRIQATNVITKEIKIYNSIGLAAKELGISKNEIQSSCKSKTVILRKGIQLSFLPSNVRWQNPVKNLLNGMNLLGKKAFDKSIPNVYKYASVDDRTALLQGLMDTDGTVKKGGEASFCTTSKQLALDLIDLVRSLGGRATLRERNRIGKKTNLNGRVVTSKRMSYEFTVSLPSKINPFYISRKASRHRCSYMHRVGIQKIELVGQKEVQCILVDNEEHLYLTNDFIVTHNTMNEKMAPWMSPIRDNLEFLLDSSNAKGEPDKEQYKKKAGAVGGSTSNPYLELLMEKGRIEIEAVSFIRGRSLPNALIIIEEAQNLTLHELKTIVTRAGEGSKIVLCGDLEQIDKPSLDAMTNGLAHAIEKFKDSDIAAHITLTKGERSLLATYASNVL